MDRRVFVRAHSRAWNPDRLRPGRQCNPVRKESAEGPDGTAAPGACHERVAEMNTARSLRSAPHGVARRDRRTEVATVSGRLLPAARRRHPGRARSEEHTSELQSLMRISYAVFCLKKKKKELSNQHKPYNDTQHGHMTDA